MQFDTPYYRQRAEPANVKHALIDPSHTFYPTSNFKKRRNLRVYSHKKNEPNVVQLTARRRVTYNIDGKPIIRLNDEREDKETFTDFTPVDEYRVTLQTNQRFFEKINNTQSLKDKLKFVGEFTGKPFRVSKQNGISQSINFDDIKTRVGESAYDSQSRPKTDQGSRRSKHTAISAREDRRKTELGH